MALHFAKKIEPRCNRNNIFDTPNVVYTVRMTDKQTNTPKVKKKKEIVENIVNDNDDLPSLTEI